MKKLICVLVCISFFSGSFLFAENGGKSSPENNTKVSVEKPAPEKRRPKGPPPERPHHRRERVSDTLIEAFADLFIDLFFDVTFETNTLVVFDDYPYATSDYFIQYDIPGTSGTEDAENVVTANRLTHFEAGGNIMYFPVTGIVNSNLRLEGYVYKFFGPFVELSNFLNTGWGSSPANNQFLGNVKAGMEIATLQTFLMSWSWDLSWIGYYGKYFTNGVNVGVTMKSYPFRPIVILYRFDCSAVDTHGSHKQDTEPDSDVSVRSHLEIGAMINNSPWEAYAAWDYLYDELTQIDENGFGLGVKYHF